MAVSSVNQISNISIGKRSNLYDTSYPLRAKFLALALRIKSLILALPPLALALTLLALLTHEQGHICILCHKMTTVCY
jgi:hypothetical protein